MLSASSWEVTLNAKKASVQVDDLSPGDEDRVRQLLDGAALEANAGFVDEAELFGTEPVADEELDDDGETETDEEAEPSVDEELTGRFRGFADGDQ